jgi:hypothetical protein
MNVPAVTEQDHAQVAPSAAPPLPIEGNLVAAVRALEAAKAQCEHALFLLQFAPRSGPDVFGVLDPLQGNVTNAVNAYDASRPPSGIEAPEHGARSFLSPVTHYQTGLAQIEAAEQSSG